MERRRTHAPLFFWAIQRLPEEKAAEKQFNMAYLGLSCTMVAVGVVDGDSISVTTEVVVPNSQQLY